MNRTTWLTGLFILGLAACGGDRVEGDAEVSREVITQPDTQMVEVQVPVVDTAVVERRVDIDTAVAVDTIQNPQVERRNP